MFGGPYFSFFFYINGKKINIHGSSLSTVTIGKQVFQVDWPIADITDEAILGMESRVERQVNILLESGLIEESSSPWASNVVLVTKKDGNQRLCVDYRRPKELTVKDAFPLPDISDSLGCLSGAKWFSTSDMASGYRQVTMDSEANEKSAFRTTSGLYQWKVMPFGLTISPGTFEWLITLFLKGLQFKICLG